MNESGEDRLQVALERDRNAINEARAQENERKAAELKLAEAKNRGKLRFADVKNTIELAINSLANTLKQNQITITKPGIVINRGVDDRAIYQVGRGGRVVANLEVTLSDDQHVRITGLKDVAVPVFSTDLTEEYFYDKFAGIIARDLEPGFGRS